MELTTERTAIRRIIRLNGIVQGVGFRPFVYRLACELGLAGVVRNNGRGVVIEVEGSPGAVKAFLFRLPNETPPRAKIFELTAEETIVRGGRGFAIDASDRKDSAATMISPDIAVCDDCLRELLDPADRRYRYPFINCTNCGPRYTIVRRIPYDRPQTSMSVFELCDACRREYENPADRRFHAQPNACPSCGPSLNLLRPDGREVVSGDSLAETIRLLKEGVILAIRGLGGYHLAVDARNDAAVRRLRERKGRAGKPFAMMAPDVETVRRFCRVSEEEECLLTDPARPIVLLAAHGKHGVSPSVAPGQRSLGFMLPNTPLHHLLLRQSFEALVMTSANLAEEPIVTANEEALERLAGIADFLLTHDRDILQRCDDSVARVVRGRTTLIRRSRGFVPAPVFLPEPSPVPLLAVGGEQKNTIALCRGKEVYLSQHVGDLDNEPAHDFFRESIEYLESILEIEPAAVACDLHPEYLSTKWAMDRPLWRIPVQHHHAHLAAVMAENGVTDPTIGIILDGTGYGPDGTIWGGEVLIGDLKGFSRFAHLEELPLPGGDKAIREPWRLAVSALIRDCGPDALSLDLPFLKGRDRRELQLVGRMIERRVNTPVSSSAGRLFDAVSAILGIRGVISYEAQAAIELEMAAAEDTEEAWYLPPPDWIENGAWRGGGTGATTAGLPRAIAAHRPAPSSTVLKTSSTVLKTGPLVRQIVADVLRGEAVGRISARFHVALAQMFIRAAIRAREETGIERVGLSGGVFQNVRLFNLMCDGLEEAGFQVLVHSEVPTNDGGLAFGQAAVAAARLSDESAAMLNESPAAMLGDETAAMLSDGAAALSRNGG